MKTRTAKSERKSASARRSSKSSAAKSGPAIQALRFRTIVVPIDFSSPSRKALEYARALAKQFRTAVHLVHVFDVQYEAPVLAPLYASDAEVQEKMGRRLRALADEFELPMASRRCHVRIGKSHTAICEAAQHLNADLIVTATHGYTGLKRLLLGSTAEGIVRHAPCPVLVVRVKEREFVKARGSKRAGTTFQLKQVLVPTDFSGHAQKAFRHALAFAKPFGAKVTVLNVVYAQYFAANAEYLAYDYPELLEETRRAAKNEMAQFIRSTSWKGVPVTTKIEEGYPVEQIVARAAEFGADLIVTSTHGRTGLQHALIGSTAEQVVRHAGCPVLVVPRASGRK